MHPVVLHFADRRQPWVLAFEPWAQSVDVPARKQVRLELHPVDDGPVEIGISYHVEGIITVGTDSSVFMVEIDGQKRIFDFS